MEGNVTSQIAVNQPLISGQTFQGVPGQINFNKPSQPTVSGTPISIYQSAPAPSQMPMSPAPSQMPMYQSAPAPSQMPMSPAPPQIKKSQELPTDLASVNSDESLLPEEEAKSTGPHAFAIVIIVLIVLVFLYFIIAAFAGLPPFSNKSDFTMRLMPEAYFELIPPSGDTADIVHYDNEGKEYILTYQGQTDNANKCKKLCIDDSKCGSYSFNQPGAIANQCWFSNHADSVMFAGVLNAESQGGIKIYK